jgi:peptidoglycan/LPS O-acetylase OafA/YrhL
MTPQGSSVAFASGAAVHFFLRDRRIPPVVLAVAVAAFLANVLLAKKIWGTVDGAGFHVSVALTVVLVTGLAGIRASALPSWVANVDRWLGDLSYPIFLCHFQLGAIPIHYLFQDVRPLDLRLFLVSLPLVHAVALALHFGVERPIARVRDAVRPKKGFRVRDVEAA